jgi:hypothetical protein
MGVKEKFFTEFTIVRMSKSSLVVRDKDGRESYIHRNAFNNLDIAQDYRLIKRAEMGGQWWIEVLVWKSF